MSMISKNSAVSNVSWAISAISVPEGPHASLEVQDRTLRCASEYPLIVFFADL